MLKETPEERQRRLESNDLYLNLPYSVKVSIARDRIRDWERTCAMNGKTCAVSVGGLDSITLLAFVRDTLGDYIDGISVSSLEDPSIQAVHKEMGVIRVSPLMSKQKVLQEFGFPVLSKLNASKIERLCTPGDKSPIVKAYMTGEEGAWGRFGKNERFKLPETYIKLFGGHYAEFRPDIDCQVAPFKVSDKCCVYLKELPIQQYQEEHNIWPFLGLMQSEGGRRQYGLRQHGCNYVGKNTARSCPFNYFNRDDLLQLALDMNVHVPEIYGEIIRGEDGQLMTTKAQRTGCQMCGFGIQLEKRPHRFDRLYERNPKEWEYWMLRCCTDENGEEYGWGRVLDYIGVEWRQA